ncbi:very short patch repair endonuclease [Pseudomonas gingeri]|uniref:very short patch repair endonuclease n=1 Tax=Pseudomonas gingeri TaxID=117681 RepID=UPI0015A0D0F5|nr:very short patch repair endonuclease [Pseudomonas gingeri]NWE26812.1 DNA mismatch endonuclease Vsr [Pseudomonas gingeri]NWE94848.1 DNA mismatch endonuclease Vsr [Pseudomonas gingeri]
MVDVLTSEQRRLNMSRIRGRDTKPELLIRRGLHARGFRYRVQDKKLPGRPDLVFPRYHAVIFVHGCFWHGHDCPMFKLPATRQEFWNQKIMSNRARDERVTAVLIELGWRIANVWECSIRGPAKLKNDDVITACQNFLRSREINILNISGIEIAHENKKTENKPLKSDEPQQP